MAKKKLFLEQRVKGMDKMSKSEIEEAQRGPWPVEYRVIKVIGSTTPKINEVLTPANAHTYCEDEDWEVTIT